MTEQMHRSAQKNNGKSFRKGSVWFAFFLFFILQVLISGLFSFQVVHAGDSPLPGLTDTTLSFFKAMNGRITRIEDRQVVIDIGNKQGIKTGMRLTVLREQTPFRHPVTKEVLGNIESLTGKLEIQEVSENSSVGIVLEGNAQEGDKVRISEVKVNILFCQSKDVDWQLSEAYHKNLRETGRVTLLDTALETDDPAAALDEAKKLHAEVLLLLSSTTDEKGTVLTQRLFWVSDGEKLTETGVRIDASLEKELRFGEQFFDIKTDAVLQFDLPLSARFITTGDINGDGRDEIILASDKDIGIYTPGADLKPALGGIRIKGESSDENIWLDVVDLNRNQKDEIIITTMKGDAVTSYIYELQGSEFIALHKDFLFLRSLNDRLFAQAYSPAEGFSGPVFSVSWQDGEYRKGEIVQLPGNINIYDFISYTDPQTGLTVIAYDEDGFLKVYDKQGMLVGKSKEKNGGFLETFKKSSPTTMIDRGTWTVKDRLILRNSTTVLMVKRVPLLGMAKGLGYKRSEIKQMRWTGISMEETSFIDGISGTLLDYTVSGDKVLVLSSPMFGVKAGNILKGDNPLGTVLSIYSIKRM
jgi:hypothetical protein